MRRSLSLIAAALLALGLTGAATAHAANPRASAPTSAATYTFSCPGGCTHHPAASPRASAPTSAATYTWKLGGDLEPHAISFGPRALLDTLAAGFVAPVPQKAGLPLITSDPTCGSCRQE